METKLEHEAEMLLHVAEEQIKENPSVVQVIVVKTAKGNIYSLANNDVLDGSYEDEAGFIQKLVDEDDAKVKFILCMWNNQGIEVPSMHFREGLLETSAENEKAIIFFQNCAMTIKESMPAK